MYSLEMANDHIDIAARLREERKFVEVLAELETAERILDELDDSVEVLELRAGCYGRKASTYQDLGREKEAFQMYEKIIKIRSALKHEDQDMQNDSDADLALAYKHKGDIEKAKEYAALVVDTFDSAEGYDAGIRLYLMADILSTDMDNNYKKIKRALTLARTQLDEDDWVIFDIHRDLAEIALKYEHDDYTFNRECNKGWEWGKAAGFVNTEPMSMMSLARTAKKHFAENIDRCMLWTQREVEACGVIVDKDELINADMVIDYVFCNITLFAGTLRLDKSVTIERVSKSLDLLKDEGREKGEVAMAQWLAGCATLCIGKAEKKRKAIRLIMDACRVFQERDVKGETGLVTIGEGYIADYHFQRKEYELAEQWYQAAMKSMMADRKDLYTLYGRRYSDRIAKCRKYK
ncbi:MAG: tetratricopeptide repeat protein [Clostridiales bacterium]|jgi:tetratricopeptide (TPR) repeat protein|nr:tetratricopeptide repeat protein [Clostridiales bacterium]